MSADGTGPKSSKKSTKKITTAKEVKETKSVPITVELNKLKVLINERSLIPLLRILKKNKELHTRELLITMGSWGYGQILMKRATNLGLIERKVKKDKNKINKTYEKEKRKYVIFTIYQYLSLICAFCRYITMFCNVFSKLFRKKEKKDSKNDKKTP